MLDIKVLGPGCANCQRLEAQVKKVVAAQGVAAQIEKVTDFGAIMKYAIMATPGLVINGKVVAAGRIPSETELARYLAQAAQA